MRDLATGDDDSWREFQQRYGNLIRWYGQRRGLRPADCDDLLQEVLLALNKAMPGFVYDPAKGTFRGYLKTVVERMIRHKFVQGRGPAPLTSQGGGSAATMCDEAIEALWENEWRQYHVQRAVSKIEAEFRPEHVEAFKRHWLRGEPARRVADALDMSSDLVYKVSSLIRQRVTRHIAGQVEEEG